MLKTPICHISTPKYISKISKQDPKLKPLTLQKDRPNVNTSDVPHFVQYNVHVECDAIRRDSGGHVDGELDGWCRD